MTLRFLGISIAKWITLTAVLFGLMAYLIPQASGWLALAPMGLVTFAVAFGFAEWAFRADLPDRKMAFTLAGIWLMTSIVLQFFLEIWLFGRVWFLRYGLDIYGMYALELAAIFLAAFLTRRRRVMAVAGEGLLLE
jgi:hypothetical protein